MLDASKTFDCLLTLFKKLFERYMSIIPKIVLFIASYCNRKVCKHHNCGSIARMMLTHFT